MTVYLQECIHTLYLAEASAVQLLWSAEEAELEVLLDLEEPWGLGLIRFE